MLLRPGFDRFRFAPPFTAVKKNHVSRAQSEVQRVPDLPANFGDEETFTRGLLIASTVFSQRADDVAEVNQVCRLKISLREIGIRFHRKLGLRLGASGIVFRKCEFDLWIDAKLN